MLKRKIETYLVDWKKSKDKKPLVIKGIRQCGKTYIVRKFAEENYENVVYMNFILEPDKKSAFAGNIDVDTIILNLSALIPGSRFISGKTCIILDEIQECKEARTALKSFHIDGRFDVIATGSLLGVKGYGKNKKKKDEGEGQDSVPVGYETVIDMYPLDFEEFLWAKGYKEEQINDLYEHMKNCKPFSDIELSIMFENFKEYMVIGGMPAIVYSFIKNKNYSGTLKMQKQILLDYEEDITKYAKGVEQGKILNVYRKIPVFLGNENKKFQISKIEDGARSREYIGTVEWLNRAGIINVCYCLEQPELPLGGNYNPDNYRIYFRDTGLLIGSLDEEAQEDLRNNKNFNTYKGAIYENIIADMLVKQGYNLYFYKNKKSRRSF